MSAHPLTGKPEASRNPTVAEQTAGRLLKAEDLAERWQVGVAHVYRLTRLGLLPAVKLGRYYRYRLDAVEAFECAGGVAADV